MDSSRSRYRRIVDARHDAFVSYAQQEHEAFVGEIVERLQTSGRDV
jgi:hypothetical protein